MKLIKCPRCELNYINENETMCALCRKDVRGEKEPEEDRPLVIPEDRTGNGSGLYCRGTGA